MEKTNEKIKISLTQAIMCVLFIFFIFVAFVYYVVPNENVAKYRNRITKTINVYSNNGEKTNEK